MRQIIIGFVVALVDLTIILPILYFVITAIPFVPLATVVGILISGLILIISTRFAEVLNDES